MTDAPAWYDQDAFDVRCEWGLHGVQRLAPISDAVVIVDVLSFSTSVVVAVERGAVIYPYAGPRADLPAFAASRHALVAGMRDGESAYSLSPHSLLNIPAGTRLVLPSPNGSTLSLNTGATPTLAGCLRNARAVAQQAQRIGPRVAVIAAGERWRDDGSLRPCFEDQAGAGAIIYFLNGTRSSEAEAAVAVFERAQPHLLDRLRRCGSGRELIERGTPADVDLAAELNASDCAPLLLDGAYVSTLT